METVDSIIMGRKTYAQLRGFDIEFPYKGKKCFEFSRSRRGADEYAEYYRGTPDVLVHDLKKSQASRSISRAAPN